MRSIEIDVYFQSQEQIELEGMGIKQSLSAAERRKVTFYTIDYATPIIVEGQHLTEVFSGGDRFLLDISYNDFKRIYERNDRQLY